MDLEKSLDIFSGFLKRTELEMENISREIDEDGFLKVDESLPVFVKTSDFMGSTVDPFNANAQGEEKKIRDTILAVGQVFSEIERDANRSL